MPRLLFQSRVDASERVTRVYAMSGEHRAKVQYRLTLVPKWTGEVDGDWKAWDARVEVMTVGMWQWHQVTEISWHDFPKGPVELKVMEDEILARLTMLIDG